MINEQAENLSKNHPEEIRSVARIAQTCRDGQRWLLRRVWKACSNVVNERGDKLPEFEGDKKEPGRYRSRFLTCMTQSTPH